MQYEDIKDMLTIAIVVPPLIGHINPTLSLGGELLRRGHRVVWFSLNENFEALIPPKGEYVRLFDYSPGFEVELKTIMNRLRYSDAKGFEILKEQYDDIFIPLNRLFYSPLEECFSKSTPDIVIYDNEIWSAALLAYKMCIPYVTSISDPAACERFESMKQIAQWRDNKIQEIYKEFSIESEEDLLCSSELAIIYSSREFIGKDYGEQYMYVGPLLSSRPINKKFDKKLFRSSNRPNIIISFGTLIESHIKELYEKLVNYLGCIDCNVLALCRKDLLSQWPENFVVEDQFSLIEILEWADLTICHGGHNTVTESLYYACPLMVIPLAFDQFQNAKWVETSGAGLVLKVSRLNEKSFHKSLNRILSESHFQDAAKHISQTFLREKGIRLAADAVEKLARI